MSVNRSNTPQPDMALHGSLQTMSVPDLLQFLAVGRKTGLLSFSHGKVVKGIYFEDGVIIGSSTNDPREYLGQVLMHYGKITEEQLQAAMEAQREDYQGPMSQVQSPAKPVAQRSAKSQGPQRRRLGQVLVDSGVLTKREVAEVLEIRTLDIIYELFIWKVGVFEFQADNPLSADFTRIHVQPNRVVMEGVYRADELARYQTLIPSDHTVMEVNPDWNPAVEPDNTTWQLLQYLEKRKTVAEISYNVHASPFEVYGQLYELVQKGVARVAGELPQSSEPAPAPLPNTTEDRVAVASSEMQRGNNEKAITIAQSVLDEEPNNGAAQELLTTAERKFVEKMYQDVSPLGVPKIVVDTDVLSDQEIGPQEGFILSRINGEWDLQSILSICPFREADSLRMIKNLLDKGIIGF